MGTFTVVSSVIGKCISCRDYDPQKGCWALGKCISETTKVKNRDRYDNSKTCGSYLPMNEPEMREKFNFEKW